MLVDLLGELAAGEAVDLMVAAGGNVVSKIKAESDWKKVLVDTGKFFAEHEQYADQIFENPAEILSKANMVKIANELKSETGYGLKDKLLALLMDLMARYEIPHETAYSYAYGILYTILSQIREIMPERYDRYFQEDWREEQANTLEKISVKIEKVDKELAEYRERQIEIYSADEMDIRLKRSTVTPQIGVDFFSIDDEAFKELFLEYRLHECVYVKARCREEAIYCIINELWKLNDNRAIFVVQSREDWERLRHISASDNIFIPWFYADEISAIKGNTNIFVLTDDLPVFSNDVIELRPRTHSTLAYCLQKAGLNASAANRLLTETHQDVEDLRKMRKEKDYKEALILTGNYIYCAQLPDYEDFEFLEESSVEWPRKILETNIKVYTPEDMYFDYHKGKISFTEEKDSMEKEDLENNTETAEASEFIFEDLFDDFSEED